jgi:hypothetical protein
VERAIKDTVIERSTPVRQPGPHRPEPLHKSVDEVARLQDVDEDDFDQDEGDDDDYDFESESDDVEIDIDEALHQREVALEYHRRRHDVTGSANQRSLSGEGFFEENEEQEVSQFKFIFPFPILMTQYPTRAVCAYRRGLSTGRVKVPQKPFPECPLDYPYTQPASRRGSCYGRGGRWVLGRRAK